MSMSAPSGNAARGWHVLPGGALFFDLLGVERVLHHLDEVFLARGLLLLGCAVAAVLTDREVQRELAAGDLVERLGQERSVLRLLGLLPVEGRVAGELDRERVSGQLGGMGLAQDRGGRDRLLLHRGQDRALPRFLELLELERRRFGRGLHLGTLQRTVAWRRDGRRTALLELLEAIRDRPALEVGGRPRHLDERQLERQPGVAEQQSVAKSRG